MGGEQVQRQEGNDVGRAGQVWRHGGRGGKMGRPCAVQR
jgi:hypothetical protein